MVVAAWTQSATGPTQAAPIPQGTNLFSNGGFQTSLSGWTTNSFGCDAVHLYEDTTVVPSVLRWSLVPYQYEFVPFSGDGTWLNCDGKETDPSIAQTVSVTIGQRYRVSGYVRTGVGQDVPGSLFANFRVCVDSCVGAGNLTVTIRTPATDQWLPFEAEFTAAASTATVVFLGEVIGDVDYLLDEVSLTPANPAAQLTDTAATCETVFLIGDYPDLSTVQYSVKRGRIQQTNPGVFYYWEAIDLPAGGGSVVQQSATSGWSTYFSQAPGSQLFDGSCTKVKGSTVSTDGSGTTSVIGSGIGADTYYLAVKYSASSLSGTMPPGTDPTYSFISLLGGGSVELDLVRK